jgi:hypothetical protein
VDLGHLADAHDTPEKPQLVEAGDSGDSSLAVHFPASCTSPGMKVLVRITFDTIDSLGAKKQIHKGIWCSPEVVTPNPIPQHRSEAAGADNPGIMSAVS